MSEKTHKNQEQRLRRALNKVGYSLHRSRAKISLDNLGDYMIVDQSSNSVVAGSRFDYTLEDVEAWLNGD